jgi:hypothetical protein
MKRELFVQSLIVDECHDDRETSYVVRCPESKCANVEEAFVRGGDKASARALAINKAVAHMRLHHRVEFDE